MLDFILKFLQAVLGKSEKQADALVGRFRVADLVCFEGAQVVLLRRRRGADGQDSPEQTRGPEQRSEEYTSELQSRLHLGCRPLLAKKKTRTSLSGHAEELQLSKVGGTHLLGQTSYQRRSAGFEINDLCYFMRDGQQSWSTWVGYFN